MIFKHIGAIKHITNMIFKKGDDLLHKIGGSRMKQQVSNALDQVDPWTLVTYFSLPPNPLCSNCYIQVCSKPSPI